MIFLNTNLDVVSRKPLDALTKELADYDIIPINERFESELWMIGYEGAGGERGPEAVTGRLLRVLSNLTFDTHWRFRACLKKEMNLGLERLGDSNTHEIGLSARTLSQMGEMGIDLKVTIYPKCQEGADDNQC